MANTIQAPDSKVTVNTIMISVALKANLTISHTVDAIASMIMQSSKNAIDFSFIIQYDGNTVLCRCQMLRTPPEGVFCFLTNKDLYLDYLICLQLPYKTLFHFSPRT